MRLNLGIRRRLAPLLGNDRRRMELLYGLLLSMPGTPVLYYGDEIGMGDNLALGDRDGVRTPMQWDRSRNAGFSAADPGRLRLPVITDPAYHYEWINVEAQQADPHSLLWWQKRLLALRRTTPVFGRGSIEFLQPENRHVLAYLREYQGESVLVVANLSRFVQHAELDLSSYAGQVPVEMFSRNEMLPIGGPGYPITLGPHDFYWFQLQPPAGGSVGTDSDEGHLPQLPAAATIDRVLAGRPLAAFLDVLPAWLRTRRWYGGKARRIRALSMVDVLPLPDLGDIDARLVILEVGYVEGEPDRYALPLALAGPERAARLAEESPGSQVGQLPDGRVLYDAFVDAGTAAGLLSLLDRPRSIRSRHGTLEATRAAPYRRIRGSLRQHLPVVPIRAEQSNSSVIFGDRLILKLYRKIETGINPDVEIGRLLTDHGFAHTPAVAGDLEYRPAKGESTTMAVAQAYVHSEGDAWSYILDALDQAYENALTLPDRRPPPSPSASRLLDLGRRGLTPEALDWIGGFLESIRLLGVRTAELHRTLATATDDPAFAPEPLTSFFQRSVYQQIRSQVRESLALLARRRDLVPKADQDTVDAVVRLEGPLLERIHGLVAQPISGSRIRIHGDYHAGQVLWTGTDFVIIDFEGEPGRPLSERRLKRSPLRDVAGMLRSFHYAAYGTLRTDGLASHTRPGDELRLEPWARFWYEGVAATFLRSYLDEIAAAHLLPTDDAQLITLLDGMLLQKALYELVYELNNRPAWTSIPMRGILELADTVPPGELESPE
jgi:maltose alpha-D-glucosyltransferase / alpha-amylase